MQCQGRFLKNGHHETLAISLFYIIFCGLYFLLYSFFSSGRKQDLSPLNFGLAKARNGVERYNVLYETHKAAIAAGVNVDYTGIKKLVLKYHSHSLRFPSRNTMILGVVLSKS